MVDNGKYTFVFKPSSFEAYAAKLALQGNLKKSVDSNSLKIYYVYIYKDDFETLSLEQQKNESSLEVKVVFFQGKTTIEITNSIRKWYYGTKSLQDFNLSSYKKCLKILSRKLSLSYSQVLQFRINILEAGINLKLDANCNPIMLMMMEHKRIKQKNTLNNKSTVEFEGENIKVICYDKLKEISRKSNLKDNTYKKLSKRYFFLRLEVKFTKVSGVAFAKENIRTINDLLINWEAVYKYFITQIKNITFADWISPLIVDEIKFSKNSELYEWIKFLGLQSVGLDKIFILVTKYCSRPSEHKNKLVELSEKFRALRNPSLKNIVFEKIANAESYILS